MKSLFVALFLFNGIFLFGQLPHTLKAASDVCDSLESSGANTFGTYKEVYAGYLKENSMPLVIEVQKFLDSTKKSYDFYDRYYSFQQQRNCKAFRIIYNEIDDYLKGGSEFKRELYLVSKELFFAIETNQFDSYVQGFEQSVVTKDVFDTVKKRLVTISDSCYLSALWIGVGGNTFRFRLYDIYTDKMMLLIDFNFSNSDKKLDEMTYRFEEIKQPIGSGEEIPPPPPPPGH